MKKKAEMIVQMDPFATYTPGDKVILVQGGVMQREDFQLSVQLPAILDAIIREKTKDWFLDSDYDAIKAEVDTRFKLLAFTPPKPELAAPPA